MMPTNSSGKNSARSANTSITRIGGWMAIFLTFAEKQPVSFAVISRCAPDRVVRSDNEKIVNQRVGLQLQFVPDADRSF